MISSLLDYHFHIMQQHVLLTIEQGKRYLHAQRKDFLGEKMNGEFLKKQLITF